MKLAVKHSLLVFDPERDDPRVQESGLVLPIAEHRTKKRRPTIEQVLTEAGWRFDLPTVCKVNGQYYARSEWGTHRLAANDNVEFLSRPLGGAGGGGSSAKSIGAIVAMVALTAIAPWAMGAIGLTGVAASIGSSLLIAGGAMAISHFLKPKAGGKTDAKEELYSFGFGGNQARPLQPIPVLYGRTLSFPDFAAPRYSEYDGDKMTEYALLALTCGKADIEEIRIADTRIWTKSGGYNPSFPGIKIQIRDPGQKVTLFPVNVVTASEVSGLELTTTNTAGFSANAATTLAREILVDFVFPSGSYQLYKEKVFPTPVRVIVEARTIDDAGAPTSGWGEIFDKTYNFAKQSQIRVTERIEVNPARYEIRARRTSPPITGRTDLFGGKVTGVDDIVWSALRAHIDGPNSFPGVTTIAVKAEANSALQGVTNGQIGVIATRIIPTWDGTQWVDAPSRSIAWAALDIWRNADYGAGLPLSQVDFQSFYAYDQLWASLGHTFDHVFKEPQTLDDAIETILKAGRAVPAPVGDRLTIVRDEPRGLPRMMFTDYDIVRDSLEISYELANDDLADGIIGEYIDSTTMRLAEVSSAPDGVTLAKPSRVQLPGVTKRSQAAGLVRFMAGENALRRVMVSWTARAEGRLLKRGDLVLLSCEEPETWGQSAEVVAYDDATRQLTFDRPLEWDPNALNHYVEIRRRDGQPWGPVRVTRGTSDRIAIVDAADMASEATRQGYVDPGTGTLVPYTLADAVARSDLADLPTAAFSPGQPRTFRVLITEGMPDTDGEHITLSGVLDDPAVYDVTETGVTPLPDIPDVFAPAIPVITSLAAQVYQRGVQLVMQAGWQPAKGAVTYRADVSYDGQQTWLRTYEGEATTFEAIVGSAQTVFLRVAGVTPSNVMGVFSIVQINPPPLVLSNDFFIMKIRPDDLVSQISRKLDTLDLLQVSADLATESRVIAEEADERGRAAITRIETVEVNVDKAYAIFGTEVLAEFDNAGATVSDNLEALATADQAIAQSTNQVKARLDNVNNSGQSLEATVTTQSTAIANVKTGLQASYTVKLTAGNEWSGFQLVQTDGTAGPVASEFKIATDKFLVYSPGYSAEAVFGIGTRNGVARVVMRGDLIADGSVNANQINVLSLSAITANIGTITSGDLTFGGVQILGSAQRIEIYDAT
ncbi:host specificity factor TipJ family phage tail protein [Microvirga lenta]|uniref:host specificity factor TipJ family phage tail protein n=1 Tax=Microvirga lenta TaxID=2881337 RepID=UPI001CFC8113|nr:host specificity factor TipJ family phage tail protein [Microvirga lenta]MCB5173638.1 phage tail protein [Microvirga lenta]